MKRLGNLALSHSTLLPGQLRIITRPLSIILTTGAPTLPLNLSTRKLKLLEVNLEVFETLSSSFTALPSYMLNSS
jgi:hypothetical protein